jgi:hypothetical protein
MTAVVMRDLLGSLEDMRTANKSVTPLVVLRVIWSSAYISGTSS